MQIFKNLLLTGFVVLSLSACELMQPSDDPMLAKLDDLEQRLGSIERVMQNQSLVAMSQQVNAQERRGDEMQGRVEELEHNAENTAERQRQLYVDLDARIQEIASALSGALSARKSVGVMDGGTLPPGQLPVPGGSDRDNYRAAFELLKEQRYEPAAMAFEQFLLTFPDSELADNAQYWLAESHYVTKSFTQALGEFEAVISRYPGSLKVPDALLKMGYCNYELRQMGAARVALARVQSDYPGKTAARLAGQRLKRMDEEGV